MGRRNSLKLARADTRPRKRGARTGSATSERAHESRNWKLMPLRLRYEVVSGSMGCFIFRIAPGVAHARASGDRARYNAVETVPLGKRIVAFAVINRSSGVINRSAKARCSDAIVNEITLCCIAMISRLKRGEGGTQRERNYSHFRRVTFFIIPLGLNRGDGALNRD